MICCFHDERTCRTREIVLDRAQYRQQMYLDQHRHPGSLFLSFNTHHPFAHDTRTNSLKAFAEEEEEEEEEEEAAAPTVAVPKKKGPKVRKQFQGTSNDASVAESGAGLILKGVSTAAFVGGAVYSVSCFVFTCVFVREGVKVFPVGSAVSSMRCLCLFLCL